jgi:hypothetical protein
MIDKNNIFKHIYTSYSFRPKIHGGAEIHANLNTTETPQTFGNHTKVTPQNRECRETLGPEKTFDEFR